MNVKLAKLIVEKGYLTLDKLKTAVEEQKNTDKSLGIILIERGFISEEQLLNITNYENEFDAVDLNTIDIPEQVIKLIPADKARDHNLIPFELSGSLLSVAMLDPTNIVLIDELRFLTGYNIKPYITLYSGIRNALTKYYNIEFDKKDKLDSKEPDNDYESKSDALSVNVTGASQTSSDLYQEPTVNKHNYYERSDISVSKNAEDQQSSAGEDIRVSDEGGPFKLTEQEESVDADMEIPNQNKKVLDKIDIFNLSPDEIQESRSYTVKGSRDSENSSPQDFNFSGVQTTNEVKTAASQNPPESISSYDDNAYNLFQAPSEPKKQVDEVIDNLFQAPADRHPEKPDVTQDLFTAPDKSKEDASTQERTTEKEFGIPFTFKLGEEPPKLEPESEQNVFNAQDAKPGVQPDPFRAFSGNDQSSVEPVGVEANASVNMKEISEDNKSETELKEPELELEHVETHLDVGKSAVNENDLSKFFQASISSDAEKVEEKPSAVTEQEKAPESGSEEFTSQSTDIELDSINVDTSYDNIESLNKDLQNQDSRSPSAEVEHAPHETPSVMQQEGNVTSSPDNGKFTESKAENEKILQLEEGLLEQEDDIVRPTVLVVDDSPTVQKIVSVTLNRRGYNVEVSSNAMQALAKLNDCIPDIIFLDINLPHMDGYQLCKVIKSNELTKTIPVVMLSGKDGFFDKMRGKMVGATDYITKPFEPNTLVNAIEKQGITITRTN